MWADMPMFDKLACVAVASLAVSCLLYDAAAIVTLYAQAEVLAALERVMRTADDKPTGAACRDRPA